jgi:8-oxo-dGTP pyrophosphatase MutT (NUDIX family)
MPGDSPHNHPATGLIEAATVVVLRMSNLGTEVLLGRRPARQSFGGLWVFPGGRVESEDQIHGGSVAPGSSGDALDSIDQARQRSAHAAVRETTEEFGIELAVENLVPLSHWTPPPEAPKRFATWFFATAMAGNPVLHTDDAEIVESCWLPAHEALDRAAEGSMEFAIPTWMTLAAVATCEGADDLLERAGARTPPRYATRLHHRAPDRVALWHGDVAYESGDLEAVGARHRVVMGTGRWHLDGDPWTGATQVAR